MTQQFIATIAEALEKDQGTMKMSDHFREYEEWDSLTVLAVMVAVEETYGVVLSRHDLDTWDTLRSLYDHVTNRGT